MTVACVLITLAFVFAAATGEAPGLRAIDIGLLGAIAFWLSRLTPRFIGRLEVAPPLPEDTRIDSPRKTAMLAAPVALALAGLAATTDYTPVALPLTAAVITAGIAWQAERIRRFERVTGSRVFRERRTFERGAPFFYRRAAE